MEGVEVQLRAFLNLALGNVNRSVSSYGRLTAMDRALSTHGLGTWRIPESDWTLEEHKCLNPSETGLYG